ncbi:hypothetical protein O6H91_03G001700 [Diphasiastrum complanatum]|uniref:Uncharacterized protein n=1 Tax=Diphasiastrum complanatum TaxID=34168 RepID=A0ACC2E2V2_DIPCM|nr:hypothetical protein O6H91_03G001700 [Diphasiastrum complanatum]
MAGSVSKTMTSAGKLKLHSALILAQFGSAGFQLLTRVGLLDNGMNRFAYPVYRNAIACILLASMAFSLEREERPPLTWALVFQFFLLGFTGIFLNQSLYLEGLVCTNATFASAMANLIPGLVFVIAALFRLEEVNLSRRDGQAKTLGTTIGVIGAIIMSVYKGPILLLDDTTSRSFHLLTAKASTSFPSESSIQLFGFRTECWQLGALCIIGNSLAYALWIIIQTPILKKYPARLHVSFFSTCWGFVLLALFGFTQISEPSQWKITSRSDILVVLYAGMINSGIAYSLQSWCIQNGGPVLVAVYQPLQTVVVAVLAVPLLGDSLSVGSVFGGLLIVSGLYLVTWGQGEQQRLATLSKDTEPLVKNKLSNNISGTISESLLKSCLTNAPGGLA